MEKLRLRWMALDPEDVSPFIPPLLPNVVEAGYYVRLDDGYEGTAMRDEDDETEDPPYKSWPIAPNLRRFATTAAGQLHFEGCPLVGEYAVTNYDYGWGDMNLTGRSWQERWKRSVLYIIPRVP